jgi:uncharacterized damage-inducible protein DinB
MAPEQSIDVFDALQTSSRELNAALAGISESQAAASPAPGRWSVLECLEHVVTVEERFLGRLEQAERTSPQTADKDREAQLSAMAASRAKRAEAPEPARPSGRFTNLAEALHEFNAVRTRSLRFVQDHAADLYSLSAEHPRFGHLNGAELLLIVAGHAQRHADQIREVTATLAR